MNLYLNCATDYSIVDQDGAELTPEQARAAWETGEVTDYNLAFFRLVKCDFDIAAVRSFYARKAAK